MKGKNYLEDAIKEAHDATAHGGVEKTKKWLTDKFICQPFSSLVKEYVASCDTCQRTKYSNKLPLVQVTMLHVPARAWTDITMDFLKISPVFTYCSTLYPNIPLEHDQMICFSRLWTIVCSQSGFMFLIPFSGNLTAEKCTDTFDTHVASVIGYHYYIVFDRDTLFMSDHFKDWAARKGIKLEPIKRRPVWTFLLPLHAHLSATNHLQMRYSFPITVYHMPRHMPQPYIN